MKNLLKYFLIITIQIYYLNSIPIRFTNRNTFIKNNFQNEDFSQKKIKNIRKLEQTKDDIAIIHINDVHCGINDTIGYDGFVLYRNELKKKYKHVLAVDIGDHIQGGTLGAISQGEAIIKIMNKIEFNVSIIGNHEFDYGIDQLIKLEKKIKNNYICANFCYNKNKSTIFEPYKILEVGDQKIAFIGVVTPYTFYKSSLSNIKDENGEAIYDLLNENHGQKLYDTIQNYIKEVKNVKGANYIILLAHFGLNGAEDYTSDLLLKNLEGVDAVLDGHTHLVYNSTTKDKTNKVIHLTQSGTKLQSIGMLILKKDGSIISENIDKVPAPEDIEGSKIIKRGGKERWVNTEMNEFINSVWDEYKDELNSFIGKSYFDLIVKPGDSHHTTCRIEECTIGNIVADAVKDAGYAECSILASNSFKDNIYKGDITWGKIINILPYFNSIFVKQLPGQIILDSLEAGVSKLPDYSSQFPQVSGITFDVDSNITSPVITDENGIFVKIEGSRRVSNAKINGKTLDLNKIYTVSLSDYIANGGNGLYNMLNKYEVFNQSFLTDSDATSYFIKNNLNGKIPKKYKEQQGRINIDGKNKSSEDKYCFNSSKIILILSLIFIIIRFIAYLKRY